MIRTHPLQAAVSQMRSILLQMSHVAWFACLYVCVSVYVGHTGDLCRNGWTDRDAV